MKFGKYFIQRFDFFFQQEEYQINYLFSNESWNDSILVDYS